MTRDNGPCTGDTVQVTYRTEYSDDGSILPMGRLVEDVRVEVLGRADDPNTDPLDTVRLGPNGAVAIHMHVWRTGDRYVPGWRLTRGSVELTDAKVVGWQVVGVVPTAAATTRTAVTVPNEPHGLTGRLRDDLLRYAREGALNAAAGVLTLHTTMSSDEAIDYVRDMSEYQSYLSEHGEKKLRAFEGPGEKWLWYEVAPGHCITAATRKHAEDAWVGQYSQDRSYGTTVDELLIDGYTEVSA